MIILANVRFTVNTTRVCALYDQLQHELNRACPIYTVYTFTNECVYLAICLY